MTLHDYLKILRERWAIVLIVVLVAGQFVAQGHPAEVKVLACFVPFDMRFASLRLPR